MESSYFYTKNVSCCGDEPAEILVSVKRVVFIDPSDSRPNGFIHGARATQDAIINYKALSRRNGNTKQYSIKRVGLVGSRSGLGQAAQAVGSILTPGNVSRVRSPIRSRIYSALTPGMPGLGRGIRGRERTHRCPEGYQYGGRFTDSAWSTCGMMLFGIPGPLGAIIAALRRAVGGAGPGIEGSPITAGASRDPIIQSRKPQTQIPKVGPPNPNLQAQAIEALVAEMAKPNIAAHRMIRRDGFHLEPVVTPAVLRTIPDNRDMEGATYLMTMPESGMGKDELGLLSNTGVTQLTYVRPDGTTVSLAKVRELTVGERRKLGRTVNAAMKMDDSDDPLARLKHVSEETGDGISIIEKGTSKPTVGKAPPKATPEAPGSESGLIGSIEEAIQHLEAGGPLSEIAPSILQQALKRRTELAVSRNRVTTPDKTVYTIRSPRKPYEHLNASLAARIQKHLGLDSPDIALVGKGPRRQHLIQDAASVVPDAQVDRNRNIADFTPDEIAAMLVSDVLTDVWNRPASSITALVEGDTAKPIAIDNPSELVDLDKLKISERTRLLIQEMRSLEEEGIYGRYFRELRAAQRQLFQQQLTRMIARAERFNIRGYRDSVSDNGELNAGELAHLDIQVTIFDTRLSNLKSSLNAVITRLGAA